MDWGGGYGEENETLCDAQGIGDMGVSVEGPRSCKREVRLVGGVTRQ